MKSVKSTKKFFKQWKTWKLSLQWNYIFKKRLVHIKNFKKIVSNLRVAHFNRPPHPHPPTRKQSSHMCSWSLITLVALELQILEITYIPNTILTQCSKKVKIVFGKSINRYMLEEIQHHFEVQGLWLWLQVRVLQFMHKKTIWFTI